MSRAKRRITMAFYKNEDVRGINVDEEMVCRECMTNSDLEDLRQD